MRAGGARLPLRVGVWLAGLSLQLALAAAYAGAVEAFDDPTLWRVALFAAMGLLGASLPFLWPDFAAPRRAMLALFLAAAALRAVLLPTPPSDDIHRYLWEGKLLRQGADPYAHAADAPERVPFRDAQWEAMNHKDKPTAYPPVALAAFAALGALAYHPLAFKLAFVAFDLAALAIVAALLRGRGLPLRWAAFHALSPVALVAFAAEGHFDSLMVAAVAAAAWLAAARRPGAAGAALALAVHVKLLAVVAAPFLLLRLGRRSAGGFALAGLALALPFAGQLPGFYHGLRAFATERAFNGAGYQILELAGLERASIVPILAGLLALALLARWLQARREAAWEDDWLWCGAALLLFSPTFHFWYLAWLLPAIAVNPSLAWLAFGIGQAAYFLVWDNWASAGVWDLALWQSALLWLPLLILGVPELRHAIARDRRRLDRAPADRPETAAISVVVPALQAAVELPRLLDSLQPQLAAGDEVVVADGGSTDATERVARVRGARFVAAEERGRGNQVATGLKRATGRLILILHADSVAAPGSLAALRRAFARNPGLAGGCLGQRFPGAAPGLLLVEALNEARATLGGGGFGDQGQFYDRRRLPDAAYPRQPLMEDVELSLRLLARGKTVCLDKELVVDAAKWRGPFWTRFRLVVTFVARYRWARLFGEERARAAAVRLYRRYYGADQEQGTRPR